MCLEVPVATLSAIVPNASREWQAGQAATLPRISIDILTPWCRVLLEMLTGFQLVKKFPTFQGTRRFITAINKRTPPVSILGQSAYPHPTSWRSILILSTHLRLGLTSGLFPSGFPTKTLYTPSPHPYSPHAQPISFYSNNVVLMLKNISPSLQAFSINNVFFLTLICYKARLQMGRVFLPLKCLYNPRLSPRKFQPATMSTIFLTHNNEDPDWCHIG